MKPEPSEVVLCDCRSPPPGPPRWFLKKSSNGEPGGSFGIVLRSPAAGPPLASTVCEVEMLTTASITFSATSAMPSGPRANAGGALTTLAAPRPAPRQIAGNPGRRRRLRAGIAAVIVGLFVLRKRISLARQCAPEQGCRASIGRSFHRQERRSNEAKNRPGGSARQLVDESF